MKRRNREVIQILKVKNRVKGNLKAHELLKEIVDSQTLLALSGGSSPNYQAMIVEPADILPGAVCVVDERYGEPFHQNSNELLLKNSGLISYLDLKNIDFYKILEGKRIDQSAEDYDQLMSELLMRFPEKIGVMGIGTNLHTAGIFPNSEAVKSNHLVVYETVDDEFPQRVTLTLKALSEFQNFIILVFGEGKRHVLEIMLDEKENNMQSNPAIFYRICKAKSWVVTDIDY